MEPFPPHNNQKVFFSQGNLQYKIPTNIWRFADNQYDYIRDNSIDPSDPWYTGIIDMFRWGTGDNPINQINGEFIDWGSNIISNGGNAVLWRTLSIEEWNYVINIRNTQSGMRFAKAQVNELYGLILLPDNWTANIYNLNHTNESGAEFTSNVISASDWGAFEDKGAVFLPAKCIGVDYEVFVGEMGAYWSSSYVNEKANYVIITMDGINVEDVYSDIGVFYVRLVQDVL